MEIRPSTGFLRSLDLRELWAYRELVYFFTWRDVKVRYKQTFFGATWAVAQPFIMMIVFTFVFGRVLDIETPSDVPTPVFYYAALLPWTLFTNSLTQISGGVSSAGPMIQKIYFPKLVLPLSAVGSHLLDFSIALTFLFAIMFGYGLSLQMNVLWFPVFTLFAVLSALAIGLWLSALGVRYRDVRYVVPFVVQAGLFLTPVINQSSQVSDSIRTIYFLNPMAGVVEGFRWALVDAGPAPGALTFLSAGVTLVLLLGGIYYFKASERTFADFI